MISSKTVKKGARSLGYLRGDLNYEPAVAAAPKPTSKCKYKYRRTNTYHHTFNEIMGWGKNAVKSGTIKIPPNNKPNFPYFQEQYIQHLKQTRGDTL